LRKGKVKKTGEYNYLGNWLPESGKIERQIEELEKKKNLFATEVMRIAKEDQLGKMSTEARLLIYEKTVVPTLTHNLECWTNIEERYFQRLEKLQGGILKIILRLPTTTPYWGIIKEVGIWPIKQKIQYHRLMLYENMMKSDDERLGKIVIQGQKKLERKDNWYHRTEELARKVGIDIDQAEEMTTEGWKKIVKKKLKERIEIEWEEKQEGKRKTRHQIGQRVETKEYIKEMGVSEASGTIRRRLEMMDIGNNFGKGRICECGEKETTEPLLKCLGCNTDNMVTELVRETNDINKIRKVNNFIGEIIEKRQEQK